VVNVELEDRGKSGCSQHPQWIIREGAGIGQAYNFLLKVSLTIKRINNFPICQSPGQTVAAEIPSFQIFFKRQKWISLNHEILMTAACLLAISQCPVLSGKSHIVSSAINGKLDDSKTTTDQVYATIWFEFVNDFFQRMALNEQIDFLRGTSQQQITHKTANCIDVLAKKTNK